MKAVNIDWDVDRPEDAVFLPEEIEIPDEVLACGDEDVISDYITDQTGFCHWGYDIEY